MIDLTAFQMGTHKEWDLVLYQLSLAFNDIVSDATKKGQRIGQQVRGLASGVRLSFSNPCEKLEDWIFVSACAFRRELREPFTAPAHREAFSACEAKKCGEDKGVISTNIKCAIAAKRNALYWLVECTYETFSALAILTRQLCLPRSRGSVAARELASHRRETDSIPGRVTARFFHVGIVPDNAAGRQVFSGISHFAALSFRCCCILTSIPLIDFQDLAVKSLPNLVTHSLYSTTSRPHSPISECCIEGFHTVYGVYTLNAAMLKYALTVGWLVRLGRKFASDVILHMVAAASTNQSALLVVREETCIERSRETVLCECLGASLDGLFGQLPGQDQLHCRLYFAAGHLPHAVVAADVAHLL
ncbi:hypothetical protein PR048_012498 [Dryococelus australis]|uniref:Uncharacterized protein n=1 Tax=Dryococelus australis TaxID=614101 RepID=A0ABQ9HPK2_9NEOP|nr:hypothetical protein PR048_012498 [Dryococelus australis]